MTRPAFILLCLVLLGSSLATNAIAGEVETVDGRGAQKYPTLGLSDAPVTIELFLRLADMRSKAAVAVVKTLAQLHPRRLRVIIRLTGRHRRVVGPAQNLAQEAFVQGRFFEFLTVYYANSNAVSSAPSNFPELAKAAGVNYARVRRSLRTGRYKQVFQDNYDYAQRVGVFANPGLRINGRAAPKLGRIGELETLYDSAYAMVLRRRAEGQSPRNNDRIAPRRRVAAKFRRSRFAGPMNGLSKSKPSEISMPKLVRGAIMQGPENARVTVVFLCNFQSVLCRSMARNLRKLRQSFPDDLRLGFRPLYNPLNTEWVRTALLYRASLCAADQSQSTLWAFYQFAFESQRLVNLGLPGLVTTIAKSVSTLRIPLFEECLHSSRHRNELKRGIAELREAGIDDGPALVVNGVVYWGRLHLSDLRTLVEYQLRAGLLEQLGAP